MEEPVSIKGFDHPQLLFQLFLFPLKTLDIANLLVQGNQLGVRRLDFRFETADTHGEIEMDGKQDQDKQHQDAGKNADLATHIFLLCLFPVGKKIDSDHWSPIFREAKPTATAAIGPIRSAVSGPILFSSNLIILNGSTISVSIPMRRLKSATSP